MKEKLISTVLTKIFESASSLVDKIVLPGGTHINSPKPPLASSTSLSSSPDFDTLMREQKKCSILAIETIKSIFFFNQRTVEKKQFQSTIETIWKSALIGLKKTFEISGGFLDDSTLLSLSPILEAGLSSNQSAIVNSTIDFWQKSFGSLSSRAKLNYPTSLIPILNEIKRKASINTPGLGNDAEDVTEVKIKKEGEEEEEKEQGETDQDQSLTKDDQERIVFMESRNSMVQKRSVVRTQEKGKAPDSPSANSFKRKRKEEIVPVFDIQVIQSPQKHNRAESPQIMGAASSSSSGSNKKARGTKEEMDFVVIEEVSKNEGGEDAVMTDAQIEKRKQQRADRNALTTYTALDTHGTLDLSFAIEDEDLKQQQPLTKQDQPILPSPSKQETKTESPAKSQPPKGSAELEIEELLNNINTGATPPAKVPSASNQLSPSLQFSSVPVYTKIEIKEEDIEADKKEKMIDSKSKRVRFEPSSQSITSTEQLKQQKEELKQQKKEEQEDQEPKTTLIAYSNENDDKINQEQQPSKLSLPFLDFSVLSDSDLVQLMIQISNEMQERLKMKKL